MKEGYYLKVWSGWLREILAESLNLDNGNLALDFLSLAPFMPPAFWETVQSNLGWAVSQLIWREAFESLCQRPGMSVWQTIYDNAPDAFDCYQLVPSDYLGIVPTDFLANFILLDYFESVLHCTPKPPCQKQWLEILHGLLQHCGWVFPFKDICIICDRPTKVLLDRNGYLKTGKEPAIEFADGWTVYG